VVVNDAMRRDRASVYGGPVHTPRFDAFARAHLLFENAVAPASWTKPSIATLFTSLHPSQHGVTDPVRGGRADGGLEGRDPRALDEAAVDRSDRGPLDPYLRAGHTLEDDPHSTVTDLAKLRGWSTSAPRITAMWYASSCSGIVVSTGRRKGNVWGTLIMWSTLP